MKTFTAFCTDDNRDTIWIDSVEADTPEQAGEIAIEQCADAWEVEAGEIILIGLAAGEVEILKWDDGGINR